MSRKKAEPEHRNFDCPKYNQCLDRLAKGSFNARFDCTGCDPAEILNGLKTPVVTQEKEKIVSLLKKCSKCGLEKDLEKFAINRANPDGREYACRECMVKVRRDRRIAKNRPERQKPGPKSSSRRSSSANPGPSMKDDGIFLERSILLAVEKAVALKLLKKFEPIFDEALKKFEEMIQEAYA
jgi:hypothetical protein